MSRNLKINITILSQFFLQKKLNTSFVFHFFLFLFFPCNAKAQLVLITGNVLNNDLEGISNCRISENFFSMLTQTDKKGKFVFTQKVNEGSTIHLKIQHTGYADYEHDFLIHSDILSGQTVELQIILEAVEMQSVDVFSGPQIIYKSDKLNVSDFEFLGDKMVLITYEKRPGNNVRVLLTDNFGKVLSAKTIEGENNKLERDFNGNIHLIGENSVRFILVENDKLLLYIEKKEEYENFIKPISVKQNNQYYFSNYVWHYPAFSHYSFNAADSSYKALHYVEDKFLLELYRAEYKYVDTRTKLEAARMQLQTGIDKEIWAAVWNGFPNSLYYKPVYAPLFASKDTVMIFDHYKNHLYRYNRENEFLDSVSIQYHLGDIGENWKKKLMRDEVTGKIYSLYERNGNYYLAELNHNGQIIETTQLEYKYPEKIKVNDDAIYFNYRPFESQQNKFLYKQFFK